MNMADKPFSGEVEAWLKSPQPKNIASLSDVFGEKGFALAFLLLLALPALPIPTGGVTHVFEVIAMLLALEMMIGRRTIWLPRRWRRVSLGKLGEQKALPFLIRRIRWFERFSRPRLAGLLQQAYFRRIVALVILVFSLSAFLSPPFSGLDTLPALGVVVISLGLILEDIVLFLIGLTLGGGGIGLIISLGAAISKLTHHLW